VTVTAPVRATRAPAVSRPTPSGRRNPGRRPPRRPPIDAPWLASDLIRCATIVFAGLIALAACWYGISGQANYDDQVPWLVGAVGALAVSSFGIVGWLLAGIREVHREMNDVLTEIRTDRLGHEPLETSDSFDAAYPVAQAPQEPVGTATYVSNASMTRAHRPDCQHVQGRIVEEIDEAEIERRGLTYCGVCC
jgi:hypothetical protein